MINADFGFTNFIEMQDFTVALYYVRGEFDSEHIGALSQNYRVLVHGSEDANRQGNHSNMSSDV